MPAQRGRQRQHVAQYGGGRGVVAFGPSTISGLSAHYDFTDATTLYTDAGTTLVTADADAIYQANDKTANAYHLTQSAAGQRPLYKTNIVNSKSVARFDGTDDLMNVTITAFGNTQTWVFVVKKQTAAGAQKYFLGTSATSQLTTDSGNLGESYGYVNDEGGSQAAPGYPDSTCTDWTIGVGRFASLSDVKWYWNGVGGTGFEAFDPADAYAAGTALTLGGRTVGGLNSNHEFAEVMFYNAAVSVANINLLGNYLATKYGLTWTTVT